jgi:hypothetical protein
VTTVLDPIIVPPGGKSVLTTVVRPAQAGQVVSLQRHTSNAWSTVNNRTLSSSSTQTWRFRPGHTGSFLYRVRRAGVGTIVTGTSTPITLTVTLKGRGSSSAFAYGGRYHGHPWSWNPCQTIHYQVNLAHAPAQGLADVKESLRRIHLVNGLTFHYDGRAHIEPNPYSAQRVDLLIGWVKNSRYLGGGAVGLGGANDARPRNGHMVIRHGFAMFDAGFHLRPGFGRGITEGQLLMHELGHAVGLAHGYGKYQVMNPVLQKMDATVYGAGDIYALKHVGRSQGCL